MGVSLVALLLLALAFPTHSIRFVLQSGKVRCFFEDVKGNAISVGKYAIAEDSGSVSAGSNDPLQHYSDPNAKITVKVINPSGKDVHYADTVVSGNFVVTGDADGRHTACFWISPWSTTTTTTKTVDFEWKTGLHIRQHHSVALAKTSLESCQKQLEILEDAVNSIREDLIDFQERGEKMRDFNMETNSIMAWLNVLSFAICLSVAGAQVFYLKTFFEKKKLL